MKKRRHGAEWAGATGLSAALFLLSWGVAAQADPAIQGGRSMAMGGALRASPSSDGAVHLNPAGMSLQRTYHINSIYQYRGSDSGSLFSASIVDSLTTRLAAGVFYSYGHFSPERTVALSSGGTFDLHETHETQEAGLALSFPFGKTFHLGVTTKYARHSLEQPENTPEALQEDMDHGITMDVGAVLQPFSGFNLAAVGYNLVPLDSQMYPRMLGLGGSLSLGGMFTAGFDSVLDFTSTDELEVSYHGGAELFLDRMYAIRGGAMYDSLRQATFVTAGMGAMNRKVGLECALRQMVDGGAETALAFSLRLFVN